MKQSAMFQPCSFILNKMLPADGDVVKWQVDFQLKWRK